MIKAFSYVRYVVETLQPLCSKHLPRTLEQIVQNLGLAVEEDEHDNNTALFGAFRRLGPAAWSASHEGEGVSHEGEGVPTPVYGEKSAGSVRSGDGRSSKTPVETWCYDTLHPASSYRVASHGAVASNWTKSLSRGEALH
jgi:hypothetical protein